MAKNTDQSWIHRYRFHIVFRLQNSPKVHVTFGLVLLDAIPRGKQTNLHKYCFLNISQHYPLHTQHTNL